MWTGGDGSARSLRFGLGGSKWSLSWDILGRGWECPSAEAWCAVHRIVEGEFRDSNVWVLFVRLGGEFIVASILTITNFFGVVCCREGSSDDVQSCLRRSETKRPMQQSRLPLFHSYLVRVHFTCNQKETLNTRAPFKDLFPSLTGTCTAASKGIATTLRAFTSSLAVEVVSG